MQSMIAANKKHVLGLDNVVPSVQSDTGKFKLVYNVLFWLKLYVFKF